jgi:hypothetical protein
MAFIKFSQKSSKQGKPKAEKLFDSRFIGKSSFQLWQGIA